jgi:UDP-glucose 6-dehydrogenase
VTVSEREPIGVVGAGWVGLVTAACFAELGHRVVVREIVPEKVESLRRGEVPIHEPGLSELIARNTERLTFTEDMGELLANARLIFVCVQTPPTVSGDAVAALYEPLGAPIVRTDVSSSEMVKLASNAFLATKISFINEIANVCEELGADVTDVAKGMGLDDRIGSRFLQAGIGYGGSCFTKDVSALKMLAANSGYHFQLLNSVIEVNELQKRRVMAKLSKHLDSLVGKRVALLGLAFKPDTDDMRGASSLVLAARLEGESASVVAYDPVAEPAAAPLLPRVEMASSAMDALEGADAAVLVTEWPEFAELDWPEVARRMNVPLLIDGRNFLDGDAITAAAITYESIGRPSASDRSTTRVAPVDARARDSATRDVPEEAER